ncbi:MAG: S8 family serine peptidase, partial [Pseudomonadota bacterium]|nr:S8 family serine peptidase [Pseudomonadota bacterium]
MLKIKALRILIIFSILSMSHVASAQSDVAAATNKAALDKLSIHLKKRAEAAQQHAKDVAKRKGWPTRKKLADGTVIEIQRLTPAGMPVFYITENAVAADTVSTDNVWPGGTAGLNLDGSGMTVGEWDDGVVLDTHWEFTGRVTQVDNSPTDPSDHSTHVAGTLIAAGIIDPAAKGMAYAASLDAYDWNSDTAEMATAAAGGLLLSNHSYGTATGWLLIDPLVIPQVWWWLGGADDSQIEDYNFGYYNTDAQLWDQIAFDAPYYLIVKSAGNDRDDIGPAPGEIYTIVDADGKDLGTSTLARSQDCAPVGYDCIPTNGTAKNILTVGAVDDIQGGYTSFPDPARVAMSIFSGWGPTDDGRIKPDIVANGI